MGSSPWARKAMLSFAMTSALAVGMVAPVLPAAAQTTATRVFTTTSAVPQNAVAYVTIPTDEKSSQWAMAMDLLNRTGLGDKLTTARDEALKDIPLDAFLGGEASLVVTSKAIDAAAIAAESTGAMPGESGEATDVAMPPEGQGWAILIDARAPDTTHMGLEAAIQSQADDAGVTVEKSDYQGVPISYAPPAADDTTGVGMALAQVGDLSMVAGAPADLEPLIDTAQGKTPSIADLEGFSKVREELPAEFLMFGFFNGAEVNS
ncbi:MAG: DUF3352 domain-containing protein, partial [Thermomicrobiales bacterium]